MTWYEPALDTIHYYWDDTNPDVLRMDVLYHDVKFDPTLLREVQLKINQQPGSKLINHYSKLMRWTRIQEPGDPFIP
jgi:hypothetical protein